jgi:hypothetical protein
MGKELALLMAIGLLAGGYYLYFAPGITEKNARRVRYNMTQVEVEALFGGPPSRKDFQYEDGTPVPNRCWIAVWEEGDRKACVYFAGNSVGWVSFKSPGSNFGRSFSYSLAQPHPVLAPR